MTVQLDERAVLSGAQMNDLPDSAFAYIEPGGKKDETGRTVPRSKRHFAIHDEAHVRNALSRAPQSPYGAKAMPKIRAAAKKYGIEMSESNASDSLLEQRFRPGEVFVRAFDFDARAASDGRTLEGYAAVFNSPARIRDRRGDFDEVILPGAFSRSLEKRTPVLQYDHGKDPRVGTVPIGAFEDIREDGKGLYVRARLFDNPVVEPVRQAIEGRAIRGMSFRFMVPEGGDRWNKEETYREISETDTAECGPVVFPAYDTTSVSVRSMLAQLDPQEYRALIRELAAELRLAVDLTDVGRPAARSAGGDEPDAKPGNGAASPAHLRQRLDNDALRTRGILR